MLEKHILTKAMNTFAMILLFCLRNSAEQIGIELICPPIKEGENIITCKINKTAIDEAQCISKPNFVKLDRTYDNTTTTQCQTPVPPISCEKQNNTLSGDSRCGCGKSNQELFTYTFTYVAKQNQDLGARLECKYCIKTKKYVTRSSSDSCKNIRVGDAESSGTQSSRGTSLVPVPVFLGWYFYSMCVYKYMNIVIYC